LLEVELEMEGPPTNTPLSTVEVPGKVEKESSDSELNSVARKYGAGDDEVK
jgi:hypothetical protein